MCAQCTHMCQYWSFIDLEDQYVMLKITKPAATATEQVHHIVSSSCGRRCWMIDLGNDICASRWIKSTHSDIIQNLQQWLLQPWPPPGGSKAPRWPGLSVSEEVHLEITLSLICQFLAIFSTWTYPQDLNCFASSITRSLIYCAHNRRACVTFGEDHPWEAVAADLRIPSKARLLYSLRRNFSDI